MINKSFSTIAKVIIKRLPDQIVDPVLRKTTQFRILHTYHLRTPKLLIFFVTNRCNARCRHCFYWKKIASGTTELTLEEIKILADQLKGVQEISLTGGEPFLREDLEEIAKVFVAAGVKTLNVPTNGLLTGRITHFANRMLKMPGLSALKINVSLDGFRGCHDLIRGVPGCYDKAIRTLETLKDIQKRHPKFKVSLAATVSNENFDQMKTFIPELFRMDVPLMISPVRGSDTNIFGLAESVKQDFNPRKCLPVDNVKELERLLNIINLCAKNYGTRNWNLFQQLKLNLTLTTIKSRQKQLPCMAGYYDGVIFNNGDVALCELTRPVGNLRDSGMNFHKIWWSDSADTMRKSIRSCFCTHPCNLMSNMKFHASSIKKILT